VAAQLRKRIASAKRQGLQGLLMAAVMRRAVSAGGLSLPSAGTSIDIKTQTAAALAPASLPATVDTATLSLDSTGKTFTYRLVLASTATGASAKRGEMILRHTPGTTFSDYSGLLQVAGFALDNDVAFGCDDQMDGGNFKVARVSTLSYSRASNAMSFASRSSHYCGHPTAGVGANDAAQVASFDAKGELDPKVKVPGRSRGATLGWRGDYTRYAGDFDKTTAEGKFLLAWQAGPNDSHSRALAATGALNAATGDRTIKGFFAYADEISNAGTAIDLQGMICNWAGPGNSHAPKLRFQSQVATLASGATAYTLGSSLITYAPTVKCDTNPTGTMLFDVDANKTLDATEGKGTVSNLDSLTGTRTTVQQEITSRGWGRPSLF
jgi:hypothetical protein